MKNNVTTVSNSGLEQVFVKMPPIEPHVWLCGSCGCKIEGPIYCDGGFMEINHGGGQCKECYLKSGHVECICGAFLLDSMKFCHQCGKANKQ